MFKDIVVDCKVEIGTFKSTLCFSVSGYGTFKEATRISQFLKHILKNNHFSHITFDLQDCEKMDSTFMGIIASLACEEESENSVKIQISHCEGVALSCLSDLGLTEFIPLIKDKDFDLDDYNFVPLDDIDIAEQDHHDVIYASHSVLSSLNESNRVKFSAVLKALNSDA
jgi:anti-anti-sigma regulatory factor